MTQLTNPTSRRRFLQATGALTLSFSVPIADVFSQTAADKPRLIGDLQTNRMLSAWIRIQSAEKTVLLMVGKVELGQGILGAVRQVCADELDVELERIQIISGDTSLVPNEGTTAGSFSMPNCATAVQQASAEVRAILLGLAATKLGQTTTGMTVADGVVSAANGAKTTYWDLLVGESLQREADGKAKPKPIGEHRFIGRSVPRPDIDDMMSGRRLFLQEQHHEGLLYGYVVRPPAYTARLLSLDTAPIERMPGVVKVVRNGSFLGVVAQRQAQALAASQAMSSAAKWDVPKALPTTAGVESWLLKAPIDKVIETKRQPRVVPGTVAKVMEASYFRPYHMHASIGTSAGIAKLGSDGVLVVQTHSQSVFETRMAISKMLEMPLEKVRLQHMQGAGCYGHNNADDAAADAALLAVAVPGKPVFLQYTREQEHQWEPYGSAMVIKTKAGLDAQGNILDWDLTLWSTPHGTRPGGQAGNLLSARYLEKPFAIPKPVNGGAPNFSADRNAIALYDFPGQNVTTNFITDMPVRVSSTRGLGAYANVVAIESFIDELAFASGVDPVEYRLRFMKDPRARDAIVKAAEKFGWSQWRKRPGYGRGIGFAKYKNIAAYCAIAMEVQVNPENGRIRVLRAVASADAGHIVSPDGVSNQIEGGLVQGLSWTLKEEVQMDDTQILSQDWNSYPILTFSEVPPVEVVLIDRPGMPFLGAGEASQGPSGAALANAVFDATGVRFRRLPLTPDRVLMGLKKA
jgi:nicotinate dehydrogenase subunit B